MKNLINRKSCIAIVTALLLMTLETPVSAQGHQLRYWQQQPLPGIVQPSRVAIGVVAGVVVIAGVVVAVVLVKNMKKRWLRQII